MNAPSPTTAHHTAVIHSDEPVRVFIGDNAGDGWFRIFNELVDGGDLARLSGAAIKVYVALSRFAGAHPQRLCWPSVLTVVKLTGLGRSTCLRALDELADLRRIERKSGGGAATTTYQILGPRPQRAKSGNGQPGLTKPETTRFSDRDGLRDILEGDQCHQRDRCHPWDGYQSQPGGFTSVTGDTPRRSRSEKDDGGVARAERPVNNTEEDPLNAAAVAALRKENFPESDIAVMMGRGAQHVLNAIANCNFLERGKKLRNNRRAYIWAAVRDGYGLFAEVEQELTKKRREHAARTLIAKTRLVLTGPQAFEIGWTGTRAPLYSAAFVVAREILTAEEIDALDGPRLVERLLELATRQATPCWPATAATTSEPARSSRRPLTVTTTQEP